MIPVSPAGQRMAELDRYLPPTLTNLTLAHFPPSESSLPGDEPRNQEIWAPRMAEMVGQRGLLRACVEGGKAQGLTDGQAAKRAHQRILEWIQTYSRLNPAFAAPPANLGDRSYSEIAQQAGRVNDAMLANLFFRPRFIDSHRHLNIQADLPVEERAPYIREHLLTPGRLSTIDIDSIATGGDLWADTLDAMEETIPVPQECIDYQGWRKEQAGALLLHACRAGQPIDSFRNSTAFQHFSLTGDPYKQNISDFLGAAIGTGNRENIRLLRHWPNAHTQDLPLYLPAEGASGWPRGFFGFLIDACMNQDVEALQELKTWPQWQNLPLDGPGSFIDLFHWYCDSDTHADLPIVDELLSWPQADQLLQSPEHFCKVLLYLSHTQNGLSGMRTRTNNWTTRPNLPIEGGFGMKALLFLLISRQRYEQVTEMTLWPEFLQIPLEGPGGLRERRQQMEDYRRVDKPAWKAACDAFDTLALKTPESFYKYLSSNECIQEAFNSLRQITGGWVNRPQLTAEQLNALLIHSMDDKQFARAAELADWAEFSTLSNEDLIRLCEMAGLDRYSGSENLYTKLCVACEQRGLPPK